MYQALTLLDKKVLFYEGHGKAYDWCHSEEDTGCSLRKDPVSE